MFVAHPASELVNVKQACIAITQAKYVYVAEGRAQVLVHLSMLTPTGRRGGGGRSWRGDFETSP